MLSGANKICIDIVLPHGGPSVCMRPLSNAFFENCEDIVQCLLMLKILITQGSEVEDLFCGPYSDSEQSLFFSDNLFSLGFEPVQDDFQYDFIRMTDEASGSVALAEL